MPRMHSDAYGQWVTSLDRPCALIKELPVADIDTAAVLNALQPLWTGTPETALRLRGRIEAVLDFAPAKSGCCPPTISASRPRIFSTSSVTERQSYILKVRDLASGAAWLKTEAGGS